MSTDILLDLPRTRQGTNTRRFAKIGANTRQGVRPLTRKRYLCPIVTSQGAPTQKGFSELSALAHISWKEKQVKEGNGRILHFTAFIIFTVMLSPLPGCCVSEASMCSLTPGETVEPCVSLPLCQAGPIHHGVIKEPFAARGGR